MARAGADAERGRASADPRRSAESRSTRVAPRRGGPNVRAADEPESRGAGTPRGRSGARRVDPGDGALDRAQHELLADQISLFGIVVGIALLLSGFGFAILAIGGALRNPDSAVKAVLTRRPGAHTPAATGV